MRMVLDEETILELTLPRAKQILKQFVFDATRFLEILEAGGKVTDGLAARRAITRRAIRKLEEIWNHDDESDNDPDAE